MAGMKKWISFLLVLAIGLLSLLPYVGQVWAADLEDGGQTVRIRQTEHGRLEFADPGEGTEDMDLDGEMRLCRTGDRMTLKAEPEDGFYLRRIRILDAGTEEELRMEEAGEVTEGEKEISFTMGEDPVIVCGEFQKIENDDEAEPQPETQDEEPWAFPADGYVWGKDSKKKDTGKTARLVGKKAVRMLRSAPGSEVVIRPGTAHKYGSWGTCEFTVTTSSGQYLGYCAQPNLDTPNGTYRVAQLDNELITAALLIAPGGVPELYDRFGKNIYNEGDNNVYAYAHALIGYLYMGSLKGLSDSMASGVRHMAEVLSERAQDPEDYAYGIFQGYLKQYKAYVAYTGASDVQDIVWLEKNPVGYAGLRKVSASPEITDGNSCYSLAGAQYGVFHDSGCTRQAAVLTTDSSGNSGKAGLDEGTYYVKELTAPQGYILDPRVYTIQVEAGKETELEVRDEPVVSPEIRIYKVDRETKGTAALGAASLAGTQFRVNFYSGHYTKETLPQTAERSWIIRAGTMEAGSGAAARTAGGEEPVKISGDSFYQNGEEVLLPLGTISVEEIKAPAGYQMDSSYYHPGDGTRVTEAVHVARIIQNKDQGMVEDGMEYQVADSVIRGDFELTKIDQNTQRPIAQVPFRITSATTKESHVIMTDENGHYSSGTAYAAHSHRTNGGQPGDGLWFGLDESRKNVAVDDTAGALPYDTYTIEELRCEANQGKFLYSGSFTISRADYMVSLGNVENADIAIGTTAKDEATGTHYAAAGEVTLTDTVSYTGLQKGKTYRLAGTLMNRTTGREVTDEDGNPVTSTKTFVPKDSDGEVEVEFFFDASGLKGADVVVYEELYLGDEKLAEHTDLNDESQTIHFPAIGTKAADQETGTNLSKADEEMTIVDRVSYENLRVGRKYKITGILMDKETGRAVLDDHGSRVEAETTFTAETAGGTAEVVFRFPGRNLAGRTVVAFETLTKDNKEYAVHHDIADEGQTVYIPKIGTSVQDDDTKSHLSHADEEVTLVDTVKYENLVPGKEYVLKGTLVYPGTKKTAKDAQGNPVTAQTAFTPAKKNGSVQVTFRFDGSELAGETLVVFEELLCNGKLAAEHKDEKDEGQTVYFPAIATSASDRDTEKQISYAGQRVVIEDTVHYENLIPGKKYTVQGVLKDQSAGESLLDARGKEITAQKEFTAKNTEGDVTVVFEFDGSLLAGKTAVAFEELFTDKKRIAVHADIRDEAQTIRFPEIRTQAVSPDTKTNLVMAADEVTVVDTVTYRHLVPGFRYRLEGMLMDQKTGEPALDAKNKKIKAEMEFEPDEPDGTVELTFRFPGNCLEGRTFVVFEELLLEKSWFQKVTAAVHKDLEDEAQTIHIPMVWTLAADDETLTRQARADGEIGVTDMVYYSNVLPGNEYTVQGILMNRETGEELKDDHGEPVKGEVTFMAEEAEGEIPVGFTLSGTSLAGKTAVIFETLVYENTPVAGHEDLEETKQSICFPAVKTSAKDKTDNDQELLIKDMVTITDRVEYENLIPGTEYRVKGTVMDKASGEPLQINGEPVRAETVFVAEKPSGSIEIDFTFQSKGMEEKELVVFEKLLMTENEEEVAEHEDLEDQNQTVRLLKQPGTPGKVRTGDGSLGKIWIFMILVAACGMAAVQTAEKRTRRW